MNQKKKKIIFVCTGNTCRSPMAEILLKKELELRGWKGIAVSSAGISAKKGDTINPKSAQVLTEKGLEIADFKVTKLNDRMLRDAYAIVCMTERQREYLLDARWNALRKSGAEEIENNVYSFYELAGYDVIDPYGQDIECYRYVFGLLVGGMSALIEKLGLQALVKTPQKRGRKKRTETTKTSAKKDC
ncbi:MAG: hypothetical protein IJX87_02830 [Clostridia bacterium]|nr:hypothetical protein [Clostridia bacterium]